MKSLMRRMSSFLALIMLLYSCAGGETKDASTTTTSSNASGSIDSSFGSAGTGIVTTTFGNWDCGANALAIQSDGKIVAVGFSGNGSNDDFAIVRYNIDGSLDTSFNGTGETTTPIGVSGDQANAVAVQSDGKIAVAGYTWDSSTGYKIALVRYNANGSLDTGFNGTGKVSTAIGSDARATALAVQGDGKIVVTGYTPSGGYYNFTLVRYNTDGSLDTSFGTSGIVTTSISVYSDYAYAVGIQSDGKIIAAGYAYNSGTGGNEFALARYNADGSLDTTFGSSGKVTTMIASTSDRAYALAIQSDGKILAAGSSGSQFAVARYNINGTLDTTFNGTGATTASVGFNGTANSLAVQSDGKIIAAGLNGSYYFGLVRYNTTGSIDTLFGSFGTSGGISTYMGVTNGAAAVAVQNDGKIVAAGSSTVAGHFSSSGLLVSDFGLARYLP